MNRLKALYRGWGISRAGTQVYAPRYREEWLKKIVPPGVRRRAEFLYEQLDGLQALRRKLRPADFRKEWGSGNLPEPPRTPEQAPNCPSSCSGNPKQA
jgi:hypothetical protein